MSDSFDISLFEQRADALIRDHKRLREEYHTLKQAYERERERNRETRERLNVVIERIRALEAEADNA